MILWKYFICVFFDSNLTSVIIKATQSQVTLGTRVFGDFNTANIEWQS